LNFLKDEQKFYRGEMIAVREGDTMVNSKKEKVKPKDPQLSEILEKVKK